MAVLAGIHRGVYVMAEGGRGDALELEDDVLWFQAPVALGTVAGCGKDVLAVVAGAA